MRHRTRQTQDPTRLILLAAGFTLGAGLATGCAEPSDTGNGSGLPPDSSDGGAGGGTGGGTGEETSWTGAGTGGGPEAGDDDAPPHLLSLIQEGSWTLSPPAGPYESLTGTLTVTELLDGDQDVPACTATYALTGVALDDACAGCDAAFDVLHYLSEDGATIPGTDGADDIEIPGLTGCLAPELPLHEDSWVLGFDDDSIQRRLGAGGWQDWYEAERIGATVRFEWTATVGVEGDEDEEAP